MNCDLQGAKQALQNVNQIKDQILQVQQQEMKSIIASFQILQINQQQVNQKMKGNENILESKKKMSELFQNNFIQQIKPQNTEQNDEISDDLDDIEDIEESSSLEGQIEIDSSEEGEYKQSSRQEEQIMESNLFSVQKNNESQYQISLSQQSQDYDQYIILDVDESNFSYQKKQNESEKDFNSEF